MGLTAKMIGQIISSIKVGYFQRRAQLSQLENENEYTFIENNNNIDFRKTSDDKYVSIIDGDELLAVEYMGLRVGFHRLSRRPTE